MIAATCRHGDMFTCLKACGSVVVVAIDDVLRKWIVDKAIYPFEPEHDAREKLFFEQLEVPVCRRLR